MILGMLIVLRVLATLFILLFFAPGRSLSADFTVNPVKLSFDAKQKTDVLTITNHADKPLTLQVTAVEWSQNEEGKDVYSPTEDIIVFPKIFTVEKAQQRIVRIGAKVVPTAKERTYRIYMEELRSSQGEELRGAVLTTLMKVGIPVFISPIKASPEGKIEEAGISNGIFSFSVVNKGNVHYLVRDSRVEGFDKEGTLIFGKDFSGWYILSGRSRRFSLEVPREVCIKMTNIKMEVTADILSLREGLSVIPEMCSP